jgi:hypothetical protein
MWTPPRRVAAIQLREEHWVVADLLGKAGHIRTIPIPAWVKAAVDTWKEASGITEGTLFRSINKAGKVWGIGMTPKVLWEVVREGASRAGIEKLAPHDLRSYAACGICAKLTPNDVYREFHALCSQARHGIPPPKASSASLLADLPSSLDAIQSAHHVLEMFRRTLTEADPLPLSSTAC